MHIITENPSEALELATQYVIEHGEAISPRGMVTRELLNVTLQVEKPWNIPVSMENRKLNHNIGIKEALQLVGQVTDPEAMTDTSQVFGNYMDHGILHGAYGPRIHGNLNKVVDQLKKDYSTRQAVLTIFDSNKDLNVDEVESKVHTAQLDCPDSDNSRRSWRFLNCSKSIQSIKRSLWSP